ncbi:uncharacterized protein EDB91DRAFT_1315298 [Suillus paluster]|uniref:uncharacterized protein n=1 Tax=Suillus paluster TaxID=48578 RepID=UPI001B87AA28|nr:uncharacterized protein EDB91DRAFT_1315298 [Suillus paluster]KAG1748484.1 hypothetical protein EDB91DRAFT_1315298 [Suillus paluster]
MSHTAFNQMRYLSLCYRCVATPPIAHVLAGLQKHYHCISPRSPALTHLYISCEGVGIFTSFLRAAQTLRMDSDTTASSWSELLSILACIKLEYIILSERCHPRYIQLRHTHHSPPPPRTPANLTTLNIYPAHTMSIALPDADTLTLARACPHLYFLDLEMDAQHARIPGAMGIIVRHCHELYEGSLRLDARLDALGAAPMNDDQVDLPPTSRPRRWT